MLLTFSRLLLLTMLLLLAYAVGDLLFGGRSPVDLPEPKWSGDPVRFQDVDLPPIAAFTYYYGNDDDEWADLNPFVPYVNRRAERDRRREGPRVDLGDGQRLVGNLKPPDEEIELPPLNPFTAPPLATIDQLVFPEILGALTIGRAHLLLVRYDGQEQQLTIGETVGPWRLRAIERSEAVFSDDNGERYPIVIGSGRPFNNALDPALLTQAAAEGAEENGLDNISYGLSDLMALRDDPERLRELLSDPDIRSQIENDPQVKQLMQNPKTAQMLQKLLR